MAADAIQPKEAEAAQNEDMRTDIDLDFELDEHGRVWMIREGDCHIIGQSIEAVCLEMRKFLANVALGCDR
jgi:hypothetical protein